MIVTEGGKNIYPEDIEAVFDGLPVKEFCVFAANYLWPQKALGNEMLVLVVRLRINNQQFVRRSVARGDCGAQPPAAGLQARRRIFAVGERFSADCIAENQARRTGNGNWGGRGAGGSSGDLALLAFGSEPLAGGS
jgi:acyl-CoA synthetase (AMP-forming)/AMP-acid ligase II